MYRRPAWAEVNLEAIKHNVSQVRKIIGQTRKIMAVVKADGYGHGALEVSKACLEAGVEMLGVAFVNEALELRENGIACPIIVLGWTPPEDYQRALEKDITLSLFDQEEGKILNQVAKNLGLKAKVHLKIDTGMTRLGLIAKEDNVEKAVFIAKMPNIEVEGIFTHFAKADEIDKTYTYGQLEKFLKFTQMVDAKLLEKIPLKHVANSAGIIDIPESHLDLVRPGIMLYGMKPSPDVDFKESDLEPALSIKANISRVQLIPEKTKVSYGGIYTTAKETLIATIPFGYADGYSRSLSGKAEVLIKGKRYPSIGRICMDQFMVDITSNPMLKAGDEVVLIGKSENSLINADEIAYKLGTINYEITCMISHRVPRIYVKEIL